MRLITKLSLLASTFALLACADVKNDTDRDNVDGGSTGGQVGLGGASTGGSSSTGGTIGAGNSTNSGGGTATGGASTGGASTGGASTGGASTGGAATGGAATGGASTGGSSGTCTAVTCGTGPYTKPTSAMCFTMTFGQYGGWQVSNATGCSYTMNGATATAGQDPPTGAVEIGFSGCSSPDVSWSCWQ